MPATGALLSGGTRCDVGRLLGSLLFEKIALHGLAGSSGPSGVEGSSTCSDDANGQQHGPDGVERGVPACADHCQRYKEDPLHAKDESDVA